MQLVQRKQPVDVVVGKVRSGEVENLLTVDQAGKNINFIFNTKTTDIEVGDTRAVGAKQAMTSLG